MRLRPPPPPPTKKKRKKKGNQQQQNHHLKGQNSLISRTDKVELIATDFFSNPATVWVILSNILKVASPILWGSLYIFDLK